MAVCVVTKLLSEGKLYSQLKTQYSAEASYYVLHLNWKVSAYSMKQVNKSRSQPTLFQQTLSVVALSLGEPDKLDLSVISVSHTQLPTGVMRLEFVRVSISAEYTVDFSFFFRVLLGDRQLTLNMFTFTKCEFLSYFFSLLISITIPGFM